MEQTITLKLELLKPTKAKKVLYEQMTKINTAFANWFLGQNRIKTTSACFKLFSDISFPSAVINQTIRDTKSQKKNQKAKTFRNMWCNFNNQNFKVEQKGEQYLVSFPTLEKRIGVPIVAHGHQKIWLDRLINGEVKQGTAELFYKRGKWYIALPLTFEVRSSSHQKTMGIDLGLRYLAVVSVGTKSLFFKGNQVAFVRRRFASLRRKLGKAKKLQTIRKIHKKESNWMRDQNHKISRQIVNFAIANGVGIIRLEDLKDIRNTAKSRKEAGRSLHSWAFYQLKEMIRYKAEIAGIRVEFVNPKYTSQSCKCGHCEKANRNKNLFFCKICGYTIHADLNGAINIAKAISGLIA
ncbi:RNA-guided endonuclease InsQ/TnpB family protein [Brevibacillus reuszeri]|uniref:RNA-guided endonuclease InsQ/TnpB family protein n=1 Tax=Brevibacillus reuszeri TaxID=54915 RepID=UPI003D258F05